MNTLTPEQYKKLEDAGYSPIKIRAYERSKGFTPYDPNKKPSLAEKAVGVIKDAGSDFKEAFQGSVEAVNQGINTANQATEQVVKGEITPTSGVFKTIGGGLLAGAKVVGEGFGALLKAPFSQKVEDKAAEIASGTARGVVEKTLEDYEAMKASDDPTDKMVVAKLDEMATKYKTDQDFKAKIDGLGGVAAAAAEFFGIGKVAKVAGEATSAAVGNLSRVRDIDVPKLNVPYFKNREAEIAEGISQMKLNRQKIDVPDNAPTITAAQKAMETPEVVSLKAALQKELETNINPNKNLDEVLTRLDTLIEQGKYKEAVNVTNANTKDNILTRITQKTIDSALLAGQKAASTYRSAVEGSTARITANLDRQALKETASMPRADVEQRIADNYVNAVSPGVKGKKTNLSSLVANKKSAVSAVKNIVLNKADLEFRDVETNKIIKGELPTNLWEFGGAIQNQKQQVYAKISEKIGAADGPVDTSRISDAMEEITMDDVYRSIPQVQKRAQEVIEQYNFAEYTLADIERIIQIENDRLQAFYRGSGTQADAVVSAMVANHLRDILDETIESATGEGVKALKKQYGDLAAIERDVVHRALHNAQAREAGLVDMFGIRTIGDVASGIAGDLNALKNSAAQIAGEGFIKALNDRDALINRMFLIADQTYSP